MSILTERTVLLGKLESTFNTDPLPTAALDAANTSTATMTATNDTAPSSNYYPYELAFVSGTSAFIVTKGNDDTVLRSLVHAIKTNSATGTVSVAVTRISTTRTSADVAVTFTGAAAAVTPDATQITLGASGAQVTPDVTGTVNAGDVFSIDVLQAGWHYEPVSESFESMTFYVFYDGLMHKITGCRGTFSVSAESGGYATASFTFTGQYFDPITKALPTSTLVTYLVNPPNAPRSAKYTSWFYPRGLLMSRGKRPS